MYSLNTTVKTSDHGILNDNKMDPLVEIFNNISFFHDECPSCFYPHNPPFTLDLSFNPDDEKYTTKNVRIMDVNNNLKLYHFVNQIDEMGENVDLQKSYLNGTLSDEIVKNRGVIRSGDEIVCKTFNFTPEISSSQPDLVKKHIHSFNQSKVYVSEEGSTVRLFFFDNRWHLSTHRKIDANSSRWGNHQVKSFGEMFYDALLWEATDGVLKDKFKPNFPYSEWSLENVGELFDRYTDMLDRNKTYAFLVRNSIYNRIVCNAPTHPTIYFVGAFEHSTHLLVEGNDSGLNTPDLLHFESVDEMIDYVNKIDYKYIQGVIVYLPNQNQVKVLNSRYMELFNVRGNQPSVKFRYLQIRNDTEKVRFLCNLYPEYVPSFKDYEQRILNLKRKIYKSYVDRFIYHQYVVVPKPQYIIMQTCHGWHLQDKKNNRVTQEKINSVVDSQSAMSLNKLLKKHEV